MWVEPIGQPRHAAPDGVWFPGDGLSINMALTELRWRILAAGRLYRMGFMALGV